MLACLDTMASSVRPLSRGSVPCKGLRELLNGRAWPRWSHGSLQPWNGWFCSWSRPGVLVLDGGPVGNVWRLFWLSSDGIECIQARDAAVILQCAGQTPAAKNYPLKMSRFCGWETPCGGSRGRGSAFSMLLFSPVGLVHLPSESSLGEVMEELASGISLMGLIQGNRASIVRSCWRVWETPSHQGHGGVGFLSHVKNVWLIFFSDLEFSWQSFWNLAFVYFSIFPVHSWDVDC